MPFKKEDFEITYYILDNPTQYDVIIVESDIFDFTSIIDSHLARRKYEEALDYLKYHLSQVGLSHPYSVNSNLLKDLIVKETYHTYSTLQTISVENPDEILGYSILLRYLEGLVIYLTQNKPKYKYVPQTWLSTHDFKDKGSRSRPVKKSKSSQIICKIITDPSEFDILLCSEQYQKYALIGLLYATRFTIKMKVGTFKSQLYRESEMQDFAENSTKDFIKNKFNPSKNREEIKHFLRILLHNFPENENIINDDSFDPSYQISNNLLEFVKKLILKFPNTHETSLGKLLKKSFQTKKSDSQYYYKELGFLRKQITKFLSE